MGSSKYVGRVGALAVALGIGTAAVTWPGMAFADPDGSPTSTAENREQAPSGEPAGAPENSAAIDAEPPGGDDDTTSGGEHEGGETVDVDTSGSTGVTVEVAPGVVISSSGGTQQNSDTHEREQQEYSSPPVVKVTPPQTVNGSRVRQESAPPLTENVEYAPRVPESPSAEASSQAFPATTFSRSTQLKPVSTVQSGTPSTAVVLPSTIAARSVTPAQDPLAALVTPVLSLATGLLSFAGLVPSMSGDPTAPVDPPVLWAVLAWTRRKVTETFFNQSPVVSFGSITTSQAGDGVVTGTVAATDFEGDPLIYRIVGTPPAKGTVTIDAATGGFTYTPGPSLAGGGTDEFSVAVTEVNGVNHFHDPIGGILAALFGGDAGHTRVVDVTVNVLPLGPNTAPAATASPAVGRPDANGVIVGNLNVTDAEGDRLTYRVVTGPSYGTLEIDRTTGGFTYTPTATARLTAALTGDTVEIDSFTVAVTDGRSPELGVSVGNVIVAELPVNSVIAEVPVGQGPRAVVISPDGTRAYVVNADANTVTVLRTADSVTLTTIEVGARPVAVAVNADGSVVYVANAVGRSVTPINTATGTAGSPIVLGSEPSGIAVSPNGQYVYTTNTDSTISIITLATGGVASVPIDPVGIAFHPTLNRAYVVNAVTGRIGIVDTVDNVEIDSVPVGLDPHDIVISPTGDKLYVTNAGDGRVAVINTADNAVEYVQVGAEPRGLVLTPDGQRLFVANFADDTVTVIDTATLEVVSTVPVGDGPYGIDVNPDGTRATITNSLENTVTVLLLTGNRPPVIAPVISAPDSETGVVTGALNATDQDGHPLAYEVTGQATNGVVTVDGSGAFVYTPNPGALHAAAATPGVDTDTFALTADDGHGASITRVVTVDLHPQNRDPVIAPTVGVPTGGIVTGNLNVTDADGDPLAFTVTGPSRGTANVNTTTGAFTYTPSVAARAAAAGTPEADTDTFTVTVDDGHGGQVTSTVTVHIAPLGVVADNVIAGANGSAVYTADGARAIVTSTDGGTTIVTVVDRATNAPAGPAVTVAGQKYDTVLAAGGTRAVVTTQDGARTRVVVVDTATGQQVGATTTLDSALISGSYTNEYGAVRLSRDGTRAAITTSGHVAILNTVTGTQIGSTIAAVGQPLDPARISPDGTRVTITTVSGFDQATFTYDVNVTVFDTADGTRVGDTITLKTDSPAVFPKFSADGTRATVAAAVYDRNTDASTTRVMVIDVVTGTQIGDTLAIGGALAGAPHLSPDGSRLTVTTYTYNRTTGVFSHDIAVYETDDLTQRGTSVIVTGTGQPVTPQFIADGTRAVLAAMTDNTVTRIAVIDTTSGTQLGTTTEQSGYVDGVEFDAAGTLAYVGTRSSDAGVNTTRYLVVDAVTGATTTLTYQENPNESHRLTFGPDGKALKVKTVYGSTGPGTVVVHVIDAATGAEIGDGVSVAGAGVNDVRYSADGRTAVLSTATSTYVPGFPSSYRSVTHVAVIDMTTGDRVGDVLDLEGQLSNDHVRLSTDGTRAVVTTYDTANPAFPVTRVAVLRLADGQQLGDALSFAGYPGGAAHPDVDGSSVTVVVTNPMTQDTRIVLVEVPDNVRPRLAPVAANAPSNGVVTGSLGATDGDGDPLSFRLATGPSRGSVTFGAGGTYSYTPDATARQAAALSLEPDSDTFTVVVDDGRGGTREVTLSVPVTPAGVVGETTVAGVPHTGTDYDYSPDGTRAVQASSVYTAGQSEPIPRLIVVDPATGRQVGEAIDFPATSGVISVAYNASGTRIVAISQQYDAATQSVHSFVTVVDTATGTVVGDRIEIDGSHSGNAVFTQDGSGALLTTTRYAAGSNVGTASVTLVNPATGDIVGAPVEVIGTSVGAVVLTADGRHAYQTTTETLSTGDPANPYVQTTRVFAVDTATGAQVGDTLSFNGVAIDGIRRIPGRSTAYQVTATNDGPSGATTRVFLVDTVTGAASPAPVVEMTGYPNGGVALSANGTRGALLIGSQVVVLDTAANVVVGDPVAVGAASSGSIRFVADDSRIVVSTTAFGGFGPPTTRVTVVDAMTGEQVGTGTSITGYSRGEVLVSTDGGRAVQLTTAPSDSGPSMPSIVATVLDTSTGTVVGAPVAVGGLDSGAVFNRDESRLLITTFDSSDATVKVTAVDLGTGAIAAQATIGLAGFDVLPVTGLRWGADGTTAYQAVIVNDRFSPNRYTQLVAVETEGDMAARAVLTLQGPPATNAIVLTPDGRRILVTQSDESGDSGGYTTTVTAIDLAELTATVGV